MKCSVLHFQGHQQTQCWPAFVSSIHPNVWKRQLPTAGRMEAAKWEIQGTESTAGIEGGPLTISCASPVQIVTE